jgi:DNA-binding Xre family transcriptional regulator
MLKYNFDRVFKVKAIYSPFTFLTKAGYSHNLASKIKNNNVKTLSTTMLERLCLTIGCTPNDFMEFIPDNDQNIPTNHPLNELNRTDKIIDLTKTLNSLPLSKLEEIDKFIKEKK